MYKCVNPLMFDLQVLPCGKCYNCQMRKRSAWDLRLLAQSHVANDSVFVTLTYSNDNLVDVNKREIQLWIKKLRNLGLEFKYYAVAEYGERTSRPHYHVLLFIQDYSEKLPYATSLLDTWDKGIIDVANVTPASIHYVTKWHVHP